MSNLDKLINLHKQTLRLAADRDSILDSLGLPEEYLFYVADFSNIPYFSIFNRFNVNKEVKITLEKGGKPHITPKNLSPQETKEIANKLLKWLEK